MARKLRLEFPGACYHVINRGNYRRDLFSGKGAARSFEDCLLEAGVAFGWRLHAYVVMSNHFHLAVETPGPNLSLGMKWLQGTWAARFNRFCGVAGRPFQGRYKALHVEPGHALAQVAHYIHLNPVRAEIVPVDRLLDYEWSRLRRFARPSRPAGLEASTVLKESGGLADTADGWRCYLDYLGVLAEEEAAMRSQRWGRLSRGWMIGSKEFRGELREHLKALSSRGERFDLLGADRAAHDEARCSLWEDRLLALVRELKVELDRLPPLKSAR